MKKFQIVIKKLFEYPFARVLACNAGDPVRFPDRDMSQDALKDRDDLWSVAKFIALYLRIKLTMAEGCRIVLTAYVA
jgi:hypothetical protein